MASTERNYLMFIPTRTKDRYVDPYSGEEISRYAWRKLKSEGAPSLGNVRTKEYQELLKEYAQQTGLTTIQARRKPEFHAILANLQTASDAPDSRKSWALVRIGRRLPEWDWAVGKTDEDVAA